MSQVKMNVQQEKSWMGRNWVWMVVVLVVLLVILGLFCAVCGTGLTGLMSFAESIGKPVEAAYEQVRDNEDVQAKLGASITKQTGFQNSSITNNNATVEFEIYGDNGSAKVESQLFYRDEDWVPELTTVTYADGSTTVIQK